MKTAPKVSQKQQAGAKYIKPSMGWNLRPFNKYCMQRVQAVRLLLAIILWVDTYM